MGVGTVTVVIAGAAAAEESSSAFSSSMRGTAGASDERSFRIFLLMEPQHESLVKQVPGQRTPAPWLSDVQVHHISPFRTKHNNHLYEGRRDRISLRF